MPIKYFRLLLLISFLGFALSLRAAPDPPDYLDHPPATLGEFIRVWAQTHTGGGGIGSINWQNGGVGLGSFTTANCSTNITCTNVAGVLTITGSAGGGVTSITGDGTLITNSGSTGAVTLTTAPLSGTGSVCFTISCVMTTPNLGTPSALNLTNATALPLSALANQGTTVTVLHGNAAGNPSFAVTTPADAVGNTSGSGNFCLVTNCVMVTPTLGAASATSVTTSGNLTSASGGQSSILNSGGLTLGTSAPGLVLTGTTPYLNASGPLIQGKSCNFALTTSTLTTLLSPVNLCSIILPNAAVVWRVTCQGGWSVTAGTTPTFAVGNAWAQTPSAVGAEASIGTTNTGTANEGFTSSTSNGNILATGALTTSATVFPATWWTTFTGSATSGIYNPTASLTGTGATGTLVGFCQIL